MKGLRLLNNGEWNKPPVLTAARRILVSGLAKQFNQCTLGDAATFLNGTSYDVSQVHEFGKMPIIRIGNITNPGSAYLRTSEMFDSRFLVRPGDLLVSWSASFKSIIWPGPEGYLNQHIFRVTERRGFDRRYIRHAIEASFDEMQEQVVGIGMMHLRRGDFLGYHVPAPSIDFQRAVADYLDAIEAGVKEKRPDLPKILEKERRIVARIEELAAQIQEARDLRNLAAIEAEALSYATLKGVRTQLQGSRHPQFSLGTLTTVTSGGTPSRSNPSFWNGDIPWIKTGELLDGDIASAEEHITKAGVENSSARLFPPDTVLIALYGQGQTRGRTGRLLISGTTNQACCAILPAPEKFDPRYIQYWLRSLYIELREEAQGGAQPNWNSGTIKGLKIALPPISEQRKITAELDMLQAELNVLKRLQAEASAELDALLPSILSKAFAGEL